MFIIALVFPTKVLFQSVSNVGKVFEVNVMANHSTYMYLGWADLCWLFLSYGAIAALTVHIEEFFFVENKS